MFDFGDVHVGDRFERVDAVNAGVDHHVEDGPSVAVTMLDTFCAFVVDGIDGAGELGEYEFAEHCRAHEGALVGAVVVAEGDGVGAGADAAAHDGDVGVGDFGEQGVYEVGLGGHSHEQVVHAHEEDGPHECYSAMEVNGEFTVGFLDEFFEIAEAMRSVRVGWLVVIEVGRRSDGPGGGMVNVLAGRFVGTAPFVEVGAVGEVLDGGEVGDGADEIDVFAEGAVDDVVVTFVEAGEYLGVDEEFADGYAVGLAEF